MCRPAAGALRAGIASALHIEGRNDLIDCGRSS
jgi:hypothetical protein